MGTVTRRTFLQGAAGIGMAGLDLSRLTAQELPALPDPRTCGIDHLVVLMMENRSFDHLLGWVPGADGRQAGLTFMDAAGTPCATHDLGSTGNFQGCGWGDPGHSASSGRKHIHGGAMDGFLQTADPGDTFPISYYTGEHLPFYAGAATHFTICDHYHSGVLSSTYPNRMYMHCGQTDRMSNTMEISTLPTIWDRLDKAGIAGRYYFSDLPVIALTGPRHLAISKPLPAFMHDASQGKLPAVSFIDPRFGIEGIGTSNDDHPMADLRSGQAFLHHIYRALAASPQWQNTLLVINYDEWGGFFDHVPPPIAPISPQEAALGNDGLLGIRVPCVLIGPRARPGYVCKLQLDPNSILHFICWRFGLEPLGVRGTSSINLAHALDLEGAPRPEAPPFAVPAAPLNTLCLASLSEKAGLSIQEHLEEQRQLHQLAKSLGYFRN